MRVDGPILHTVTGTLSFASMGSLIRVDRIERIGYIQHSSNPESSKNPAFLEVDVIGAPRAFLCGFSSDSRAFTGERERLEKARDKLIAAWKAALQPVPQFSFKMPRPLTEAMMAARGTHSLLAWEDVCAEVRRIGGEIA